MSFRAGLCLAALAVAAVQTGCGRVAARAQAPSPIGPAKNTGHPVGGAYFFDFREPVKRRENGMPAGMWVSDYDFFSEDFAQVHWKQENITFDRSGMHLTIRREKAGRSPFTSGEVQIEGFYGYGRYEVVMRSAPGSGLNTSFFLHTFEQIDNDPHDEIDFEFIGKMPNQVQLNYFHAGQDFGSFGVDLGFEPSRQVHLYALEWKPDSIRWFADGRLISEKVRPPEAQIPFTSQRPLMNLWAGARPLWRWLGEPTFESGASALYVCTSHVPLGQTGKQCSDLPDRGGAPVPQPAAAKAG